MRTPWRSLALILISLVTLLSPVAGQRVAVVAQSGGRQLHLPQISQSYYPTVPTAPGTEWTQHAHDPQRTGYTNQVVAAPWRWKWAWNGPTASGAVTSGKFRLPRNSQPVTGAGRVYIAAGSNGVYALNQSNGAVAWNSRPGGNINSTPAYDADTGAVFVVSSNGVLYKLRAADGSVLDDFATGASSTLPLPPAVLGDRVIFSMGNRVYAISKTSLSQLWSYDAGAAVHTPPAYSPSRNSVIAVSSDLYVHAINNASGARLWRVKPGVRAGGNPGGTAAALAEVSYGWPVIAEGHGYVLIKQRLEWASMYTWSPWPTTNATMRTNLETRPEYQALFTLDLDNGALPFVSNVGHGGFGDGDYMPMGPQPVIKDLGNGQEVAYVVMRGSPCQRTPCEGRWDSHLGEMMLDGSTVSGYQAGHVRFIDNSFFPTDEQANLTMAGNQIFGGHWMFGIAHQIQDRSSSRGTGSNPITTTDLPHIITSASNCGFSSSHYCSGGLLQDGDSRSLPAGFYIYYNQGKVYDQYWSGYASWTISNGLMLYVSTDGAIVALEAGSPGAQSAEAPVEIGLAEAPAIDVVSASPGDGAIVPYTDAAAYAGQTRTVEGVLEDVFNNGKAVYLGFKAPHHGVFVVRILNEAWGNFAASPETLYSIGQTVRVTGLIEWYQGDPVIYVVDPKQIETIDE
ncbi:MAG TPA: PQQ-binding-like beta-propeller repeat protein [Anaerolineales bacterium]|nr:PQQ-binding-like beta-propeller repeat protein [Anaerolineales bacterium]